MLQRGQQIEDYRIVSLFSSGGMGEIYLAEEISLGRQVAIKVIRPEVIKYPNSEDARKMIQLFRREASAIAKLNHPDILPLFRFGEATIDGTALMFMVMPYCEEKSLTDWMYKHNRTTLTAQEAEPLVRQAAEALQYAHEQGIIHLDVKLSNFLVRYATDDVQRLNVQLADFGVAKFTATSGASQTVRGSLEAMAPEQWEGSPVYATDQYALAVMVYKLLTGRNPFVGTGFEQLWLQHRTVQPQPPSTVNAAIPPSIDAVLLRALAKNPQDRYSSVRAFADAYRQALQSVVGFTPIQQTLTISMDEARMGSRRMITLPSGEILPVTVPPGVSSGQVIPVERQGMPTVLVTVNTSSMIPPPPPLEKTQLAQPRGATPQFGQMPAGQNQAVNSQFGQMPAGQNQAVNSQFGQMPVGQNPGPISQAGQMPSQFDRTQLAQPQGAGPQMQFGQTQWGQSPAGQPPVGQPPAGQSQWGQPPAGQPPVGQPPAGQSQWVQPQGPQPRPKPNLTRIIVLAVIALVVIIGAVVGIFAFTTNQHNQQVAATGTASSQTQVAQNNLATQSANATATQGAVNATATAQNTFPNVAGNYSGTLTNTANAGQQFAMALSLQQNQGTLTGTCSLNSVPFPIQNGLVTLSGQVSFSITIPASGSSSASQANFNGSVQSDGSLKGVYTASGGGGGPWSVTKS